MKGKSKLTMKQKKFADALIKTNNKTKAAMIAYPNASYWSARRIWSDNCTKIDIIQYLKDNCDIASSFMVWVITDPETKISDKITAAKDVLDRWWYKPVERTQEVNMNIDLKLASMEELLSIIKK